MILAGQTLVHLPHSVHVYAFKSCSQFRSVTSEAPNFAISLRFSSDKAFAESSVKAAHELIEKTSLVFENSKDIPEDQSIIVASVSPPGLPLKRS